MRRRMDPLIKMKLYLLAIGILILALLLVRVKKEEKGPVQEEKEMGQEEEIQKPENPPEEVKEEEPEIKAPVYNGRIRVLLKTEGFASEYHHEVKILSDCELVVKGREDKEVYGSGQELIFTRGEEGLLLNGETLEDTPDCLILEPENSEEEGRFTLESLQRNYGTPVYEGTLEVWNSEEGFVLVNDLPLEDYLKYVVPSEMPSGYEIEALKAQAICARTYAYKHMQSYGYPEYEAHVDDSGRYQVYNNSGWADSTTQAVADTQDKILTYEGVPITAYYFSTSCGYTGNEEIWQQGSVEQTPYLTGKTVNESGEILEMTEEEVFADFISQTDESCYDGDVSWYRWETKVDIETLSDNLNEALEARCKANPEAILTKRGRNYYSRQLKTIGTIRELEILERNEGGAIQKVRIKGSKRTIQVETEYNVRALLNVKGSTITRKDESTVIGGTLLPSAYMTITPVFNEEGELTDYIFQGGGYGHGVGMSQNGANGMAKQGKTSEEILSFFYTDVDLTDIGSL